MATTDFLLRPAVQPPRSQPATQDTAVYQRSTAAASEQSFSSVYSQQQRANQANQQQLQQAKQRQAAAADKQQQAARNSTRPAAAQPSKETASPASHERSKAKPNSADSASQTTAERQDVAKDNSVNEQSGKVLPQESESAVADSEEQELDPLFLFALAATAAEQAEKTSPMSLQAANVKGELLFNGSTVGLKQPDGLSVADDGLASAEDAVDSAKSALKSELNVSADKGALLNSASGKITELLVEKGAAERSNVTPLLESAKAAPGTLLNNQAVAPSETIRGDLQPRQDLLLAAQQARQVLGSAVTMQQPSWTQQVTDKVLWMSAQNLKSAEIKLDPAELGRLEIKVSVGQELTQVTFTSANASVRDSLEGQMHRLRELLAQQGMQDVDVNVSDQSQQQGEADEQQTARQGRAAALATADKADETVQHVTPIREQHDGRLGLVDDYA